MLREEVIVITGASSGIGAEMAILFSKHGATVVLLARSLERLKEVSHQMVGPFAMYELDVTSTEHVSATIEQIIDQYGKIDILINNAGFAYFEPVDEAPLSHFEDMMNVNYMGTVRLTKAVLPSMISRRKGHIINIASMAGKIGIAKSAGYVASKHAVLGFTNSLRLELLRSGIHVSAVNPGPVRTSFFKHTDPTNQYLNRLPKWFVLEPAYVAQCVLKVIQRKKAEKNIPRSAALGVKILQCLPRSWDRFFNKLTNIK